MLERVVTWCLGQKGFVLFLVFLIVCVGFFSYLSLPVDAFPDVTNTQVEILSSAPGLAPLEIERFVTNPVELAMRGLPKVTQMRSVTKYGLSVVTIVFEDNVDIYVARQLVFERLAELESAMPRGVRISLGPVATAMGEIYQYTLDGALPADPQAQVTYLTELRTLQEWVVTPLLKGIPGVSEVNSFGGYFKQYQVEVEPEKLLNYGLTVDDVFSAIEQNNENVGGNIVVIHSEQAIVRGIGLIRDVEDIRNIVLKSIHGTPVCIRNVGRVSVGQAVRQGASMVDGTHEAVGGIVMMLRGENSKEVVERIKSKVARINSSNVLPNGLQIVPYYDRTTIINSSIRTVVEALLQGVVLVMIVLYVLLRSVRGSIVVLLALPLSMLATFTIMRLTGIDANLMSFGGLAISIGMIIDATIIQVENVQRHFSQNAAPGRSFTTVLKAVMEVRKPSIFGELITAMTFLPILTLEGMEGKMFRPLAATVAIALFASLLMSIVVIPSLCYLVLKPGEGEHNPLLAGLKTRYTRALGWVFDRRKVFLASAVIALVMALAVLPFLGSEFIPIMDEGAFDMDVQLLPGVSLAKSVELNQQAARRLKKFPELEMIISRTGQTGIALEARGVDKTGFTGVFKPRSEWKTASSREEMTRMMRDSLESIPGIVFSFSQPIQCRIDELVAGTRAQLIFKLFGDNIDVLTAKAEEIAQVLNDVRGTADLVIERTAGQPYISVRVDRAKIARHGLNVSDVLRVVEIAIGGKPAAQIYEQNKSFDIAIRFPEEHRNSAEAIAATLVTTRQGYNVPLKEIAAVSTEEGPVQITRENGMRRIGIEINIEDRDIVGYVQEARRRIQRTVKLPAGYFGEWGGQFENQQRAMSRLMMIGPAVIALILVLLFFTFHSLRLALLVIINLPFALIGGVFALYISGLYLSVPASVGFVVLFGVAVLNGIVLVSHFQHLREGGLNVDEAVRQGAEDRLRPVLMTALIAIFSLVPMLFATGPGSEIQKPLATVVVGGLLTSTFLTLFLIPMIYRVVENAIMRRVSRG